MKIFVPTRGRINRQITRRYMFLDQIQGYEITYVVPECDVVHWKLQGVNYEPVPNEWRMAEIRQYIMEELSDVDKHQLVIDDDLYFFKRIKPLEPSLRPATLADIQDMLLRIEELLAIDGYVHGGISAREGNNNVDTVCKENTRAMRCLFYDAETLLGEGVRWDAVQCRMDFHVSLSLIELGYPNIVDFEYAHNQAGSNAVGGASVYRTMEMFAQQAYVLKGLHPEFVDVVQKETKTAWGGGERTDVKIAWKKAFCSKATQRKLNLT